MPAFYHSPSNVQMLYADVNFEVITAQLNILLEIPKWFLSDVTDSARANQFT